MADGRRVIITCAITGAIHTPTMSPHLPVTPDEIAEAAIGAAKAGASIVHLHARVAQDGRPTQDPEVFRQFLPQIKSAADVVINITTGGAPTMSVEERLQPALRLKPEVASLNMGSMNFGLYEMIPRYKDWKHDWELPYLAGSDERIFKNTFRDIAYILESCSGNDTRFEVECYDIGHLYTALHFLERKLIKPPLFIQSVFGIRGGIGPHPEDVMHMKRTADRLFGNDYQWSVLGAGRNQMYVATQSAVLGGNVRVGLEDSLWIGKGHLAHSQCRAGRENPPDPGRTRARNCHSRGNPQDSQAQGEKQGGVLGPKQACFLTQIETLLAQRDWLITHVPFDLAQKTSLCLPWIYANHPGGTQAWKLLSRAPAWCIVIWHRSGFLVRSAASGGYARGGTTGGSPTWPTNKS